MATGRVDAYTATETSWRGGELEPFLPWLDRGQWWVGEHLGWLLVICVLALAALGLGSRAARSLGPAAWCWCAAYALYLLAFFDPTTSLLRILLPLAPLAWAAAAGVGRRGRWTMVVAGVMAQAFWISWVWDLSSTITWVP
ncbi:integral membrane protein [Actinomyces denticolens]|nr:integral membrane protein [Actinomyces denticolens]